MKHLEAVCQNLIQLYIPEQGIDYYERFKILLAYLFTCSGIILLTANSVILSYFDSQLNSTIDLTVAIAFLILVLWPKKKSLTLFIYLGVLISFILLVFLFAYGGFDQQGFIWSYTFPLMTFFLLGCRRGIIINTLFFLCCTTIIQVDVLTGYFGLYDLKFAFRFSFSFILIVMFSFFYEFFRNRTEEKSKKIHENLETLVSKRTLALEQEMAKKEKLNRQLLRAKKEWELTFDAVPAHISIIDLDNNIVRANKSLIQRIELPYQEVIGKKCCQILPDSTTAPFFCLQRDIVNVDKNSSTEVYCKEYQRHFSVTVSPLFDTDQNLIGMVHVAHDISQQKIVEKEKLNVMDKLRKAEKLEAIGRITAGVAHDLNNILSGMIAYPDLLIKSSKPDNDLKKGLLSIKDSGQRASAVVSDLLTMARGITVAKEPADINKVFRDYFSSIEFLNLTKLHSSVNVEISLSEDSAMVLCNAVHLQKMIMNLVTNAVEAVEEGGKVSISTHLDYPSKFTIADLQGGFQKTVVITVDDDGSGIPADERDKVFEPFYSKKTTGRSGSGLGLSIVKNIIDDHHGVLNLESSSAGTCFKIELKTCAGYEVSASQEPCVNEIKGTGSILIVDDNENQRELSGKMLEYLGYSVTSASNGKEAIALCQTNAPDLIMLDFYLEPDCNGLEAYSEILHLNPDQKAILTTGLSERDTIDRAQRLGVKAIVKKPFSIEDLGQAVKDSMELLH